MTTSDPISSIVLPRFKKTLEDDISSVSDLKGDFEVIAVNAVKLEPAPYFRVTSSPEGINNCVILFKKDRLRFHDFRVLFKGSNNTCVVTPGLDEEAAISGGCRFENSNGNVCINQGQSITSTINIVLWSNDNLVVWGTGSTSNGTTVEVSGASMHIIVGKDCMFAANTWVRTYDQHAIIDIEAGLQLNKPSPVRIGNHVWLGQSSSVYGARIGKGSIVGSYSLVKQNCDDNSLLVGVPARVIKTGVSWMRSGFPSEDDIKLFSQEMRVVNE